MMREIEFRGYSKYHDEWFFGSYVDGYIIDGVVEANEEYIVIENWVSVKKESVGQHTGLKDINGEGIYEGDIVRLSSDDGIDYNALIIFKDGGFCAIDGSEDNHFLRRYGLMRFELEVEVIGNIYEDKYLLEGEERG